jgi:hypothetical protein
MASRDADFAYWYAALDGTNPPFSESSPQCGWYEWVGTTREAVAIFRVTEPEGGDPYAPGYTGPTTIVAEHGHYVAGETPDDPKASPKRTNALKVWQRIARRTLPFETFMAYFETGVWPDEPQKAAAQEPELAPRVEPLPVEPAAPRAEGREIGDEERKSLDAEAKAVEEAIAGLGHNSEKFSTGAGEFDEVGDATALLAEANDLASETLRVLKQGIRSQTEADLVANVRGKVAELGKRIEDAYKTHREPLEKPLLEFRDRWRELREIPARLGDRLKPPVTAWLKAVAAEKQAEAAAQIAETGEAAKVGKTRAGSGGGRKMALRVKTRVEIVDWPKVTLLFINNPALREAVQKAANAAVAAGAKIDGVIIHEEQVAQ